MRQAPADPSLGSAVLATPQPRSDGRILPARLHGCLPTAPRALPVAPLLPGHRADVGAWRVWVFFLRIFVFSLLASFLCAGPTTSAAPSAASPPLPRPPGSVPSSQQPKSEWWGALPGLQLCCLLPSLWLGEPQPCCSPSAVASCLGSSVDAGEPPYPLPPHQHPNCLSGRGSPATHPPMRTPTLSSTHEDTQPGGQAQLGVPSESLSPRGQGCILG